MIWIGVFDIEIAQSYDSLDDSWRQLNVITFSRSKQSLRPIAPSVAQWVGRLAFSPYVRGLSLCWGNIKMDITQVIFQPQSD